MEVEVDKTGQQALIPTSNTKGDESGDAERFLATETSNNERMVDVRPLLALVSPLIPGAAHATSTELQETSGPLESSPPVLTDAECSSAVTSAWKSGRLTGK